MKIMKKLLSNLVAVVGVPSLDTNSATTMQQKGAAQY